MIFLCLTLLVVIGSLAGAICIQRAELDARAKKILHHEQTIKRLEGDFKYQFQRADNHAENYRLLSEGNRELHQRLELIAKLCDTCQEVESDE